VDVSICICTYRRPMVADTIASVLAQHELDRIAAEVIVCDDDPAQSARAAIETIAATARIPVRYVTSGAGNVATARNGCLRAAKGEWIAFIDDDEIAEPDWLSRLLATQAAHDADVVKGYVHGVYPQHTPAWVLASNPYTRDYGPTGNPIRAVASGNVLFRRAIAAGNGIFFDERFGRTGGEDTDFFRRYAALGAVMVASRDAIVNEMVPPERVTFDYFRRRYLRLGQSNGRQLAAMRLPGRAAQAAKSVVFLALLWSYPVTEPFGGWFYFRCFSKFWYSRGLLQGLRGMATEEML
jgi:succinoglycan biosynthesis protein ExoM